MADDQIREFISTQAASEKEQSLATAKQLIAGDTPLIPDAPDTTVRLKRGIFHRGQWQKEAVVRELTGEDEERLAKVTGDLLDLVVAVGTERLGDIDFEGLSLSDRQGHMRELLIGEREVIFLAIIKATFGNTRTMGFKCPVCEVEQEVDFLIDEDFKPRDTNVEDFYEYTLKNGSKLEIRLATGADQREALDLKGATMAQQNTVVISKCITKLNNGLIPDPMGFARKLGIKDRQEILSIIIDNQPNVELGVTTACSACGAEVPLQLTWSNFFRP
jgi:hypothetical protein